MLGKRRKPERHRGRERQGTVGIQCCISVKTSRKAPKRKEVPTASDGRTKGKLCLKPSGKKKEKGRKGAPESEKRRDAERKTERG